MSYDNPQRGKKKGELMGDFDNLDTENGDKQRLEIEGDKGRNRRTCNKEEIR